MLMATFLNSLKVRFPHFQNASNLRLLNPNLMKFREILFLMKLMSNLPYEFQNIVYFTDDFEKNHFKL